MIEEMGILVVGLAISDNLSMICRPCPGLSTGAYPSTSSRETGGVKSLLVPYFQVFYHKKQENFSLCVLASLRETFWLRLSALVDIASIF